MPEIFIEIADVLVPKSPLPYFGPKRTSLVIASLSLELFRNCYERTGNKYYPMLPPLPGGERQQQRVSKVIERGRQIVTRRSIMV